MSKDYSTAEDLCDSVTEEQVANYLRDNPDFFNNQRELLGGIKLPHESGKAISLVEKQINTLREQRVEARKKLNDLVENARENDKLFDTTRSLILSLLRANSIEEAGISVQDQLIGLENIDACEIIFVDHTYMNVPKTIRTEELATLQKEFHEVFRLNRAHCGQLRNEQTTHLFSLTEGTINSTALCPVTNNGECFALLALGNKTADYFNIHLDTLFIDFICQVLGAVLTLLLSDARKDRVIPRA